MCGIAGFQGNFSVNEDRWVKLLHHRGPDSFGKYQSKETHLYAWRLAVLDLTVAGNQPMTNEDKTLWIIFNGEVYNFQQLRKELELRGHRFNSCGDSEVILHLYEDYGKKMLDKIRGMFAFALYDKKTDELFIARDPFGIKPLVYSELPQGFVFASELRVLTSLPEFPKQLAFEALEFYFCLNYIPAPWTIWRHAKKLKPGHFLRIKGGKVIEEQSFFVARADIWRGNFESAVEALKETLQQSVRLHLVSDVPLGVFLSGGLDSSLVAALAQRISSSSLNTFNVTFPGFAQYDESHHARHVAKYLGTKHTEIPISVKETQMALTEIVEHLDEPFADSSLIPTAIMSKVTRNYVKVAVSGDGGDEFFGGYNKYQGLQLATLLRPASFFIRRLAKIPLFEARGNFFGDRVRQFKKLARVLQKDPIDRILRSMEVFSVEDIGNLMLKPTDGQNVKRAILEPLSEARELGYSEINQILYLDAHFVLPYDMLFKVDASSMKYSLEVRVPIIDTEVCRLAFSLLANWKLRWFQRKFILRQVAKDYLPHSIIDRPKKGFEIPIGEWLRKDLYGLIRNALSRERLNKMNLLNPDYVENLFWEHINFKRDRSWEIWNLFVLARWWEKYIG